MDNITADALIQLTVTPYLQKATALRGVARKVGGNQFRHMMATFTILIDYHYTDHVLLKASLIHDLFEDVPDSIPDDIINLDEHGAQVFTLVDEVSRKPNESKIDYLKKIRDNGTKGAKVLKVADRISNITDLHLDIIIQEKMADYLEQTMEYIYPMAKEVNNLMAIEIKDLVERRKMYLSSWSV
jgi:GTP pyrophosphokinase